MFNKKKWIVALLPVTFVATLAHAAPEALSSLKQATYLGPQDKNHPITFTVWLKLRNKEQLDKLVSEMYNPNSSNYRKFLKKGVFEQQYAPSHEAENSVLNYFTALHMQAKIINHRVQVTATTKQVEEALQIHINRYRYENREIFSNTTTPILNTDIAKYVLEISGLNNMLVFTPSNTTMSLDVKRKDGEKPHDLNFVWDSFMPSAQPTTTSIGGFTGAQLQTTYQLSSIAPINGQSINGNGQTIILLDACGAHDPETIKREGNKYNDANGITRFTDKNFKVIDPNGNNPDCDPHVSGWETEIALDVESSHTIATGAKTVLVLAKDQSQLPTAVADIVSTLINNNYTIAGFDHAYVVSNSWSSREKDETARPSIETSLEVAAAHGISFDFSSGDCGNDSYTSPGDNPRCTNAGQPISVNYPPSSIYATAVGATAMFVDNNWNYAFETGWGTYKDGGFSSGSGGGISKYYGFLAGSNWQSSIGSFYAGGYADAINASNGIQCGPGHLPATTCRALPDVVMVGDASTGLVIYEGGTFYTDGGTSLACPLFSGTLVLVNQARTLLAAGTPSPIGHAAPYLYQNQTALVTNKAFRLIIPAHQVISGATTGTVVGEPLSAFEINHKIYGWDSTISILPESQFWNDAVGLGSPNIPNFVETMANF